VSERALTDPASGVAVFAVVVAYRPAPGGLVRLLRALTGQVAHVVVVDNTEAPGAAIDPADLPAGNGVTMHANGFNAGVAAAQNTGIAMARSHGATHVLLLDQDSLPDPDMVARLLEVWHRLQTTAVAAIAPRYEDAATGHPASYRRVTAHGFETVRCAGPDDDTCPPVDVTIASGLLIPLSTLDRVGDMDATLFIDHVDTDWCLRARHCGLPIRVACRARLAHDLGSGGRRLWLGRWRRVPLHSPARHYYQWRNALLLAPRPHVPSAWTRAILAQLAARTVITVLAGPQRAAAVVQMCRGIVHGILGRGGPDPRSATNERNRPVGST
jgi:rhamnosyltransferase